MIGNNFTCSLLLSNIIISFELILWSTDMTTLGNKTPRFTRFFPILRAEWGCTLGIFQNSFFQNGERDLGRQFGVILGRTGYIPHSVCFFNVAKWGTLLTYPNTAYFMLQIGVVPFCRAKWGNYLQVGD